MDPFNVGDTERLLINPFYCIKIDEVLSMEHQPLISEELWMSANIKMIREIGIENWLRQLLQVLQGDYAGSEFVCDDCAKHCDCQ